MLSTVDRLGCNRHDRLHMYGCVPSAWSIMRSRKCVKVSKYLGRVLESNAHSTCANEYRHYYHDYMSVLEMVIQSLPIKFWYVQLLMQNIHTH